MARILVVDDSPSEIHQFVNFLAKHGHQVLTAESGADGSIWRMRSNLT